MIASSVGSEPVSLVDKVVDHVFHQIMSGERKPGEKITEEGIAADLGVSRTPVREGIKRLGELGVLLVRPRCGLDIVAVDERDVREVKELRCELEALAMRLALQHITDEQIEQLVELQATCEARIGTDNRLDVFRGDSAFHLAIAAMSGNRHLEDALRRLNVKVQLCRMYLCDADEKIAANVRFHTKLLKAMKKRDAATAERLLRQHIKGGKQ
jgi:DNA-binding GntR family transcriptional regulator